MVSTRVATAIGVAAIAAGCSFQTATVGGDEQSSPIAVRPSAIEAHIRYLADDLMEGREAGTRGYDLAAAYVASQFRLLGLEPAGAGEGGKVFTTFLATTYHRPSDDVNQKIDYAAGARFAQVNYLILKAIANADQRPAWNEGDFFGELYAE